MHILILVLYKKVRSGGSGVFNDFCIQPIFLTENKNEFFKFATAAHL